MSDNPQSPSFLPHEILKEVLRNLELHEIIALLTDPVSVAWYTAAQAAIPSNLKAFAKDRGMFPPGSIRVHRLLQDRVQKFTIDLHGSKLLAGRSVVDWLTKVSEFISGCQLLEYLHINTDGVWC